MSERLCLCVCVFSFRLNFALDHLSGNFNVWKYYNCVCTCSYRNPCIALSYFNFLSLSVFFHFSSPFFWFFLFSMCFNVICLCLVSFDLITRCCDIATMHTIPSEFLVGLKLYIVKVWCGSLVYLSSHIIIKVNIQVYDSLNLESFKFTFTSLT